MLVDLTAFAVLLNCLPLPIARSIAIWLAMTWNFALNRRLTFRVTTSTPVLRQYLMFCSACLLGAAVSWSISVGLHLWLESFANRSLVAATLGIIAGTGFNYLLCCRVVFRSRAAGLASRRPQPRTRGPERSQVPGQRHVG